MLLSTLAATAPRSVGQIQFTIMDEKRIGIILKKGAGLLLAAALGIGQSVYARQPGESPAFNFGTVREMARGIAAKDFKPSKNDDLPDVLKKMTYDQYNTIRFRREHSLWKDDHVRFTAQFCQRAYLFQDPVKVHVLDNGKVTDVPFSPEMFDYDSNNVPKNLPPTLQFGGFRLLYPLNSPQKQDEVAEFLGASYFRILGGGQRYGSSLRGLAIDTAEPSGEEFPRFTEFWLEKPPQLAGGMRVYALLDSPSVAGAYRFVIEPGANTITEVETSLFFRKTPKKIGIAPIGSLFLEGQNRTRFIPDYRPQVHDSDGLLIEPGNDNWIWRPLVNPAKEHQLSQFPVAELKGFGLTQRDREFRDYDDLGSRFEARPTYWIEPIGNWGPGTVELLEIPTQNDWNDNIVAYWIPRDMPSPGQELHLAYHLSAMLNGPDGKPILRIRSTHVRPEMGDSPPRFVIDFAGMMPQPADLSVGAAAKLHTSQGQVKNVVVETNEAVGGWQVFFDLVGAGDNRTEVRLHLQPKDQPVSETWIYDFQKLN